MLILNVCSIFPPLPRNYVAFFTRGIVGNAVEPCPCRSTVELFYIFVFYFIILVTLHSI